LAARTIRIGGEDNAPEPVEVYIFKQKYLLRRITRSVQKKLEKFDKALEAAREGDDSDKLVAAMGDGVSALLMNNGTESPDPKQLIVQLWKDDTLDLTQLLELYEELQEASVERPT
jgi:hypothetical protein